MVALIGAMATIAAATIGRQNGVEVGQQQALATAVREQSTAIAQVPAITQLAVTQVVVTQVAITQIAVTQVAVTQVLPSNTTLTPAPTATITAAEDVDTAPNSILGAGETWRQQGLTMTLASPTFGVTSCNGREDWGTWTVTLSNETDQDLVVGIDQNDFFLVDDNSQPTAFVILASDSTCWGYVGMRSPGYFELPTIKARSAVTANVYGIGRIDNQEWYRFGIRDGGRIQNASWQLTVPK